MSRKRSSTAGCSVCSWASDRGLCAGSWRRRRVVRIACCSSCALMAGRAGLPRSSGGIPMTRDDVGKQVMSARTLEECERAEDALRHWMQGHPGDAAMQEIGEGLAMLKDALSGPETASDVGAPGLAANGSS